MEKILNLIQENLGVILIPGIIYLFQEYITSLFWGAGWEVLLWNRKKVRGYKTFSYIIFASLVYFVEFAFIVVIKVLSENGVAENIVGWLIILGILIYEIRKENNTWLILIFTLFIFIPPTIIGYFMPNNEEVGRCATVIYSVLIIIMAVSPIVFAEIVSSKNNLYTKLTIDKEEFLIIDVYEDKLLVRCIQDGKLIDNEKQARLINRPNDKKAIYTKIKNLNDL